MPPAKFQEDAVIRENRNYRGDYYRLVLAAPTIVPHVRPGQFVHLLPPDSPQLLLRRPFSIFDVDADADTLTLIYKAVGAGTAVMATRQAGQTINLLGPRGTGFPPAQPGQPLLIVAGGYGCAATYLSAKTAAAPAIVMLGGRRAGDILVEEAFAALGCDVRIATDDGSRGHRGVVTDLLTAALDEGRPTPTILACGPNAMLAAVARICLPRGLDAALSLDQNMGCGVGACFTCVVKIKADTPTGWEYVRSCKDGPVFMASRVYWE